MGLDSLLTSLNRGVAGVADVQPLQHKAFACNGRESAGVAGVAAAMSGADSATAATARRNRDVTRKPLQHKACTPATAATAENIEVRSEAGKVGAGDTAATSWGWRVIYPEDHSGDRISGRVFECYIVPMQTLAEVQAIHPGARIEPIGESAE